MGKHKIIVHFTSYPATLLPLNNDPIPSIASTSSSSKTEHNSCVMEHLSHQYSNSLKQALFLQHDSNRISKDMSKSSHLMIWDSIVRNQFELYKNVTISCHFEGKAQDEIKHIPVRVMVDGRPAFVKPCFPFRQTQCESDDKVKVTLEQFLLEWLSHLFESTQPKCKVLIQGIKVPLESTVLDLWRTLSHPDRFLYILVISNRI